MRPASLLPALAGASLAAITPGKSFDRFITIWLENRDYDDVSQNSHLRELQRQGILLTRYYAHTHPSQPNYLASIAGDYFGLDHDDDVRLPHNVSTVVDLFDTVPLSWKAYMEDIPSPGYMGTASLVDGRRYYVRKHNPFVSFDSINVNGTRLLQVQSFLDWQDDFAARRVPQYVFMTPNMIHDGHNTTLDEATSWVHDFLNPMLESGAFDEKTLILLTYDESERYEKPNHIVSLLLGSAIPKNLKGTTDDTFYTHYSILSTLQFNWDLPHLGRFDVGANVFNWVFSSRPQHGLQVDPPNVDTLNNSLSYPGMLNTARYEKMPTPNLKLFNAAGKGPVQIVRDLWESRGDRSTPYDGSGAVYDGHNVPVYKPQGT